MTHGIRPRSARDERTKSKPRLKPIKPPATKPTKASRNVTHDERSRKTPSASSPPRRVGSSRLPMIWDTCGMDRSSALIGRLASVKGMFPPVTAAKQLVALPEDDEEQEDDEEAERSDGAESAPTR